MSVKLRLMRLGRKGQPFYRIVAVDSRKRRDGAYIEKIGQYNPSTRPAELVMDDEKALKWLNYGAIPSDTVRSLLSRHGVMMAFALGKRGVEPEEIKTRVKAHREAVEGKLKVKEEVARAKSAPKPAPAPAEVVATAPAVSEPSAEVKEESHAITPAETAPPAEVTPPAEDTPLTEVTPPDEKITTESENTPTEGA